MEKRGTLFVISGPSGAGKGTLVKALLEKAIGQNLRISVSATTRQPRNGEVNGQSYWFVKREYFQSMIDEDALLEWAEVYGNYYGTPYRAVEEQLQSGKSVILEIDIQGAMQVRAKFPHAVFIFIAPPSIQELANRIQKRGTDSLEVIKRRLGCAKRELTMAHNYDYIVVNDVVSSAAEKLACIVRAERCRSFRSTDLIDRIVNSQFATHDQSSTPNS
ncbi:MAG: guanylate kinase [Negativicutes bacterium]|jgi:guanylate kinase